MKNHFHTFMEVKYMKLSKKLLAILLLAAALQGNVSLLASSAPQLSFGQDLKNHGKWIGNGIGSGVKSFFSGGQGVVSKYGRAWHVEAAVGAAAIYALYNYYGPLREIARKYNPERQPAGMGRLCLWGMQSNWATHVDINLQQDAFINALESKRVIDARTPGAVVPAINTIIVAERQELNDDIAYLEKLFVEYFKFPAWLGGSHGIKRKYKQLLQSRGLSNIATNDWTSDEFESVDRDMQKLCRNSWYHFFFKINYGNAAVLWWKLKKLVMRLDAIAHHMISVQAGRSDVPTVRRNLSSSQTRNRGRFDAGARVGVNTNQRVTPS
jgi:hypothetical protein